MKEYNIKLEIENAIDTEDMEKIKYIKNKYPVVFIKYVEGLIEDQNTLAKRELVLLKITRNGRYND